MAFKGWFRFLESLATSIRPQRQSRRLGRPTQSSGLYGFPFEMLEARAMLSGVTVTSSTTSLSVTSPEIVITGTGFDPIVSNNTVAFNNGAAGIVTAATSTSLTVEFTTAPDEAGSLTAVVTSNAVSSGATVQVATIIPEVESNTAFLAANATTILIFGYGFDTTLANNVVTFDGGAAGTVTAATFHTTHGEYYNWPDRSWSAQYNRDHKQRQQRFPGSGGDRFTGRDQQHGLLAGQCDFDYDRRTWI